MSMKPQFETYRYTGEICRLQSQSIVECRLPGSEIGSILAVQAKAIPVECVCADGEARYNGKLLLCIVYEDVDRKICRVERGAEFFHKAEGASVTPACFAKPSFFVENVSYRREGSGVYVSVIVGAEVRVYGARQMEYLIGGDGLVTQKKSLTICKSVCVSGETESEDEFETDYVGDILLHSENALVTSVVVGAGELNIEGELALNVCALQSDETLCSYERLIPFRMQIPCDEAFGRVTASAKVIVKSAQLVASVDEEKGRCKILFTYCLSADCFLHAKEDILVATDAFSTNAEVLLKRTDDRGRYLTKQIKFTERVSGVAALSPEISGEYTLLAALLPRAEIACKKTERGAEAEGVVNAEVLLRSADGGYKTCSLSLPFLFPANTDGEIVEADCIVCGLNVRRKKDGETEAEATLKICMRTYETETWEYVNEVTEGVALESKTSAISIFIPRAGEDLWQVAKRLHQDPDDLQKCNPELEFPVKEGERIFIYRQIK